MSANEEVGRVFAQSYNNTTVVMSWITTDVLKKNICPFAGKAQQFRINYSQVATVDVATYGTQRLYRTQPVSDFHRANVASMPDFVDCPEILFVTVVPDTVSV